MTMTNYARNKVLDYNFGAVAYTSPATMYVGLSSTAIGRDGSGKTEPTISTTTGYARVSLTNDKTTWDTASTGSLVNLTSISFATSTTSWGTMSYVFVSDHATTGNIWYYATMNPAVVVQESTQVVFEASSVIISLD